MAKASTTFLRALLLLLLGRSADATIGEEGLCSLFIFLPFTNNGTASVSFSSQSQSDRLNPGLAMLAAALLAMDHFNDRNATIVAELADFKDCNVRFDLSSKTNIGASSTKAFDTGTVGHMASRQMLAEGQTPPCAIAGPFNDVPALELSTLAQAAGLPQVAHRAHNALVDWDR